MVGRGPKKKGVRYFGPYSHAWAIRETVDLLLRVFPMRSCSAGVFKRSAQIGRPCLLGYIGKCSAPCVGRVTAEEHREIVDDFCTFIAGQTSTHVRRLERADAAASEAPGVRAGRPPPRRHRRPATGDGAERRRAVGRHRRRRRSRSPRTRSRSRSRCSTYAEDASAASAGGWPTGRTTPSCPSCSGASSSRCTTPRCPTRIPREVLLPQQPEDAEALGLWLCDKRGSKVAIRVPQRGDKRTLLETVARNAEQSLAAPQDQAGQRLHHAEQGPRGDPAAHSGSRRRRCGSSATTCPTCRAPRSSRRWSSSRTACLARATTAGS